MKWIVSILPVVLWLIFSFITFFIAFYIMDIFGSHRIIRAIVIGILSLICAFCSAYVSRLIFKLLHIN